MPGTLSPVTLFIGQINHQSAFGESFVNHFPAICAAGEGAHKRAPSNEGPTMKGILLAVATIGLGTLVYITLGIALASVG